MLAFILNSLWGLVAPVLPGGKLIAFAVAAFASPKIWKFSRVVLRCGALLFLLAVVAQLWFGFQRAYSAAGTVQEASCKKYKQCKLFTDALKNDPRYQNPCDADQYECERDPFGRALEKVTDFVPSLETLSASFQDRFLLGCAICTIAMWLYNQALLTQHKFGNSTEDERVNRFKEYRKRKNAEDINSE